MPAGQAGLRWVAGWLGLWLSLRPSPSARLLVCLTCLRLASGPAQPATCHPVSGPSVSTRPSTAQPLSPAAQAAQPRLAKYASLRLASGPPYETGLAHPATRPSTAQPSPPSPSSTHNQQRSPAARVRLRQRGWACWMTWGQTKQEVGLG